MMRSKIKYLFLLPVLAGFLISSIVNASSGPPGSSGNPVITKSYADKVFQPLKEQIGVLRDEVAKLKAQGGGPALFTDVPSTHWACKDIQFMVDKGVISGLGDGKFGPNVSARRCELAVMLVKALNLPTTGAEADFNDVPKTHWAYRQIAAAQKAGFIQGFPGGLFKPNEYVTRGQMAVMLAKAYSLQKTGKAAGFTDVPKTYWAYGAIQKLADNGITSGYEDRTFRPALQVRRAEVAVFLAKAMDPSRRN